MAVLETIAAANAAYSVIKTCISNGRETADLMSHVGKFLGAEHALKEAVEKKKKSPLTAITGGEEGDWAEFQALERIKQQRKELESYIRLYGEAGQWDRWVKWQADARIARKKAAIAAEKARQERNEMIVALIAMFTALAGFVGAIYWIGDRFDKW